HGHSRGGPGLVRREIRARDQPCPGSGEFADALVLSAHISVLLPRGSCLGAPDSALMNRPLPCLGVLGGAGSLTRLGDLSRVGAFDEIADAREFGQLRVESVARGLPAQPPPDPGRQVLLGPAGLLAHDLTDRTRRAGRDAEALDRQRLAAL